MTALVTAVSCLQDQLCREPLQTRQTKPTGNPRRCRTADEGVWLRSKFRERTPVHRAESRTVRGEPLDEEPPLNVLSRFLDMPGRADQDLTPAEPRDKRRSGFSEGFQGWNGHENRR